MQEQNEIARQSFAGPDFSGKEVCRYHQFPMMSQELCSKLFFDFGRALVRCRAAEE